MPSISKFSRKATLSILIGAGTFTAAGAAGLHRLAVTQGTGSNGAANFLNTSVSSSALEGNVGTADTTYTTPFGVFGAYDDTADTTTFGIGVLGASTSGYGVAGESLNDTQPSVLAYPGGKGIGLESTTTPSSTNPSIYSEAKGSGDGIDSAADGNGVGGTFLSNGTGAGLVAYAGGAADAIDAQTEPQFSGEAVVGAVNGEGLVAFGYSGNSTHAAIGAYQEVNGTDFLNAYNDYAGGAEVFTLQAGTAGRSGHTFAQSADAQISGDLYVYGHVYEGCAAFPAVSSTTCSNVASGPANSSSTAVARTDHGNVQMYTSAQSLPSVEDTGSARMAYGHAIVQIDPRFAATMSRTTPYMVTVTPYGNSHGVYVTNRTPAGFEVMENDGGRSTMDFDYRIVAKPLGDNSARLAAVAPERNLGETVFHKPMSPKKLRRLHHFKAPAINAAFAASFASQRRLR